MRFSTQNPAFAMETHIRKPMLIREMFRLVPTLDAEFGIIVATHLTKQTRNKRRFLGCTWILRGKRKLNVFTCIQSQD